MTGPALNLGQAGGPNITPRTMGAAGMGGQAQPPYLQMRRPVQAGMTPAYPGQQTQPVITPKPSAMGDPSPAGAAASQAQMKAQQAPAAGSQPGYPAAATTATGQPTPGPSVTAMNNSTGQPVQAGGSSLGDVYNYFASDLANQTKQALANTTADASARGVYYGTPLTGSEADINTQYLRGLGQLGAGMYGNAMQQQLAQQGMQSGLLWQGGMQQPPTPPPTDWSALGQLFGTQPATGGPRPGPAITPRTGPTGGQAQPMNPVSGSSPY
jgi:hypothetical protein